MDAVMSFNSELAALYECMPPISKAKMTSITKAAIKAIKYYKHVVQSVEKFIQKCKTEYKIPGLYVIDSIVRQSRHQFGCDKDVFAPRFGKNILVTFYYLFKCPPEDKSRVIRVLNLWQKNKVFDDETIQPVFDLADPNHALYKEISNQVYQKAAKTKQHVPQISHTTPQQHQQQNQTPQHQHTPQTPQTPQQIHCVTSAPTPSTVNNSIVSSDASQMSNPVMTGLDPKLIQQIQQILMKTEESAVASSVAVLSNLSSKTTPYMHQPLPILGMQNQPTQVPIHQPPPAIMQAQQSAAVLDKKVLNAALSSSGDYDERTIPFLDTSLPPPGYLQTFSHSQPLHIPHTVTMPNISQKPPSPKEEGEHSGESDEDKENHQEDVIQIDDHSRSPSYSRSSNRSRKRSRSRSRSRSRHHRSRSRGRRSRSRDRRYRDRDRAKSRRDSDKDQEREKEKDRRRKKGLPAIKSDHISVCSTTLWVGHLSKLVHQEELSDTFGEYGDIVSINLIPPRGCAFICMNRRQDASRALLKLRNYKMLNKAITLAWAPGKGVKGKEFKDYWEVDVGCSYVPYSKLTSMDTTDLDTLEEGGMIDEDTVPSWLKGKLSARFEANQREAQVKPQPNIGNITVMPPVSNTLGIVQTMGKDMIAPIIPFTLPSGPPPRLPPGSLPLGPIMPPLGVPPPIGLAPMGHPVITSVPPHMSMATTSQHLGAPISTAHMTDQGVNNSAQDSDSMDVEMEDVQRSETNIPDTSRPSMEKDKEEKEGNEQNFNRFQSEEKVHVSIDQENGLHGSTQHPPFGIRSSNDQIGIRFGIVPRGIPGFTPCGIGGFLGPPPPIVAGRPGIVPDVARGFQPITGTVDMSIANRFASPPPPIRYPMPNRHQRIMEEENNGDWTEQDNDRRKYRNKNESWNSESNGMYNNERSGRRMERNERPEQEEGSNRYRDRSRMRDSEDSSRNRDSKYRSYERDDRNRDQGRSRDRGRDRYDRDQSYGHKDDRREQWGGRGRWEERRSWHSDRKSWVDDRPNWNEDRWNKDNECEEEPIEETSSGWMNSEAYALQQSMTQENTKESNESVAAPEKMEFDQSGDKPQKESTEITQKQRKGRDSNRVSRWERKAVESETNIPQNQSHLAEINIPVENAPMEIVEKSNIDNTEEYQIAPESVSDHVNVVEKTTNTHDALTTQCKDSYMEHSDLNYVSETFIEEQSCVFNNKIDEPFREKAEMTEVDCSSNRDHSKVNEVESSATDQCTQDEISDFSIDTDCVKLPSPKDILSIHEDNITSDTLTRDEVVETDNHYGDAPQGNFSCELNNKRLESSEDSAAVSETLILRNDENIFESLNAIIPIEDLGGPKGEFEHLNTESVYVPHNFDGNSNSEKILHEEAELLKETNIEKSNEIIDEINENRNETQEC